MHALTAALIVASGLLAVFLWPDLIKDDVNTFGTVGFFLTAYGVIFAIVEVIRAGAAADAAAKAAKVAAQRVEALYNIRNSAECQILIESALERLHEDGTMSASSLGRIVRLYAAEFSTSFEQDTSVHRLRMEMVNSFAFSQSQPAVRKLSNSDRLKAALVTMMADLSASSNQRAHQESPQ